MTCNRYHLWAALDVHAFSKAEAVLRFSAEEDGMWVQWQDYARLKAEVDEARRGSGAGMGVMLDLNNQLVAENARLKAEVERLTKAHSDALADFWAIHKGYFDLKAEVERLRNLGIKLDGYVDLLQGENERLRKAGDAMSEELIGRYFGNRLVTDWNAAKEGKQP